MREIDGISRVWHNPNQQEFVRDCFNDRERGADEPLPLRVDFAINEHCFEKYFRRRENSEVFSVEMVIAGSMYFVQDEKEYLVRPGEIFLVHRERDNEFMTGPDKFCKRLVCSISGNALNPVLHSCGLLTQNIIKLKEPARMEALLRDCLAELKEKSSNFRFRASLLAYEILLECGSEKQRNQCPELIVRAQELMEHHLSQRLSLEKLAALLGTSPTTLHREFQTHLQSSPILYFIDLKMSTARSMLLNTNMQIQEIAFRLGYDNPLYFSAEFKKRFGVSPRQFRSSDGQNSVKRQKSDRKE